MRPFSLSCIEVVATIPTPPRIVTFLLQLLDTISGMAVEFSSLMILGDFRLPSLREGSETAQEFMASMRAMGLSQVI